MAKILLAFLVLSIIFGFVISAIQKMSGKERWALTKTVSYAILCSLLAIVVMMFIVVMF